MYPNNEEAMEPLQSGRGGLSQYEHSSWEEVFNQLAQKEEQRVQRRSGTGTTTVDGFGKKPNFMEQTPRMVIDINELKRYIKEHKSIEVRLILNIGSFKRFYIRS